MAKSKEKGGKPAAKAAKNGKGAHDDFDKGGPDGPAKQRGMGDNVGFEPDAETLDEVMACVDEQDAKIYALGERMRLRNEPDKKAIKDANKKISDAKASVVKAGTPSEELNTLIRAHRLRRQAEQVGRNLDADQLERYEKMEKCLHDFRSTPLGNMAEQVAESVHRASPRH